MSYYDIVRALPRPTDAQRDAMASSIAQRHSWYKHLPLTPLVPFRFLIAPHAPITSEPGDRLLDRRYASIVTASDHLSALGHWMCEAPYAGGGGHVPEIRAGVERAEDAALITSDGERLPVPREVLDAGVAWVNACIDPRAARYPSTWWSDDDPNDLYGLGPWLADLGHPTTNAAERRAIGKSVLTAEVVTAQRERMLGEMRAAMDRVAALIWRP